MKTAVVIERPACAKPELRYGEGRPAEAGARPDSALTDTALDKEPG